MHSCIQFYHASCQGPHLAAAFRDVGSSHRLRLIRPLSQRKGKFFKVFRGLLPKTISADLVLSGCSPVGFDPLPGRFQGGHFAFPASRPLPSCRPAHRFIRHGRRERRFSDFVTHEKTRRTAKPNRVRRLRTAISSPVAPHPTSR